MNSMQIKRINTALAYFTDCFYKKYNKLPSDRQIHIFLTLADFLSAKRTGKPMFGLTYQALEDGIKLLNTGIPSTSPDIDYLSIEEQALLERICQTYSDDAYKQLKAWKKALERKDRTMDYLDEIEDEYLMDIYESYLFLSSL